MTRLAELARLLKVVLELRFLEECAIAENFIVEKQTGATAHKVTAKPHAVKLVVARQAEHALPIRNVVTDIHAKLLGAVNNVHNKIHVQQQEEYARILKQIAKVFAE